MKPSEVLQIHRESIRKIVTNHTAINPRVFGSVIYGTDTDLSDLDLLIDPTAKTSLLDIAKIQIEVEQLLGISVDVLTPNALPEKFRNQVVQEAQPL